MMTPEKILWQDVLMRAMLDATASLTATIAEHELQARRAARLWIGSNDFREVCELAGMDPDSTLARFRAGTVKIKSGRYVGVTSQDRDRVGHKVRRKPAVSPPP